MALSPPANELAATANEVVVRENLPGQLGLLTDLVDLLMDRISMREFLEARVSI